MGTLSVVMLIKHGFEVSFVSALLIVLDYYEGGMRLLFVWVEPYIGALLRILSTWIGLEMQLFSHWKHVFVLLGVYFVRDVSETYAVDRRGSAIFLAVLGIVFGLLASIGSGTIALSQGDRLASFLIVAIPVFGVTGYDLGKLLWYATWLREWTAERYDEPLQDWWPYLRDRLHFVARLLAVGLAVAWFGLDVGFVQQSRNPGLVLLLALVMLLTIYWLVIGAIRAKDVRIDDDTWLQAFQRTGAALLGIAMLRVLIFSALFLLTNAGLKLVGFE